jgi:proteasome lid subunit RPN8/RPN11
VNAALFVQAGGVYSGRPDVDPWPADRDARTYAGPWPVVAHPPCGPWGRYAKPTPESKARGPLKGDDAGCFASALASVRTFGGVLEHPKDSGAWSAFGLMPPGAAGWTRHLTRSHPAGGEWVCRVDQGHYGHAAQKSTWLLYVGDRPPPALVWGAADVAPIGTGARRGNLESLSKSKRAATPSAFAEVLISLARWSAGTLHAEAAK